MYAYDKREKTEGGIIKIVLTSLIILIAVQVPTWAMSHTIEDIMKIGNKGVHRRKTTLFPEEVAKKARRDRAVAVTGFCIEKPASVENEFSLQKSGYSKSKVLVNYATRFQDSRHSLTLELINNQFGGANFQQFTVKCLWPPLYQPFDSINVSDRLSIGLESLYSIAEVFIDERNRSKEYLYKERKPKIIVLNSSENLLCQKWDLIGRLDSEIFRAKLNVEFSDLAQKEAVRFLETLSKVMHFPECLEDELLQSFKLENEHPLIKASQASE
jgi:hypothetical protein